MERESLLVRFWDVREMMRLLRASVDLAGDTAATAEFLLTGMLRVLGASAGGYILSSDFRPEGAAGVVRGVTVGFDGDARRRMRDAYFERGGQIDVAIARKMARGRPAAGATEAHLRRELVADAEWQRSSTVEELVRPARLGESINSARGLEGPDLVDSFCLFRDEGERPFAEEDRNLVELFHAELEPLFTAQVVGPTLSRRQRETLQALVEGASDKQIAARLGLSVHTVHHYVTALYRAYGVGGRGELMALLLAGRATRPVTAAPAGSADRSTRGAPPRRRGS
jgi:DNA-binding CsgD family transcriptional regulator